MSSQTAELGTLKGSVMEDMVESQAHSSTIETLVLDSWLQGG